jgi:soluble lytic murein transglycosylase
MIKMARKPSRKRRVALAALLCILLVGAAVALGSIWSLYRAYPYEYRAEVEENAAHYGQDPLFVAAVIRTESRWKPGAESSAHAVGLMQIMPATGEWIAELNGWDYERDMLKDAAYNIRSGCWYLDYLSKKFGGDMTVVLAAYNAGENVVKKWVAQGLFEDGVGGIPYPETRSYVGKVKDAYEKYKFLYKSR